MGSESLFGWSAGGDSCCGLVFDFFRPEIGPGRCSVSSGGLNGAFGDSVSSGEMAEEVLSCSEFRLTVSVPQLWWCFRASLSLTKSIRRPGHTGLIPWTRRAAPAVTMLSGEWVSWWCFGGGCLPFASEARALWGSY